MKNTTMTEKLSYTLADLARLIVEKLADKPDAYATSIGEWTPDNVFGDPLKQFEALLRVDVGDWRKLLAEHEQRIAELEKDAARPNLPALIDDIICYVAELPDRNSPEDQPEMMLVSADELRGILEDCLSESTQANVA